MGIPQPLNRRQPQNLHQDWSLDIYQTLKDQVSRCFYLQELSTKFLHKKHVHFQHRTRNDIAARFDIISSQTFTEETLGRPSAVFRTWASGAPTLQSVINAVMQVGVGYQRFWVWSKQAIKRYKNKIYSIRIALIYESTFASVVVRVGRVAM